MGIFFNRAQAPLAGGKPPSLIAYVVYILLTGISVYATAESIAFNYDGVNRIFSYAIAVAIVVLIALAISIIKGGIDTRKIGVILGGLLFLFLVWGTSLITNTHKLFTMNNYDKIVQEEKSETIVSLNHLKTSPLSLGSAIIIDFESSGNHLIDNFNEEMTNAEKPCYGPEAKNKHRKVEAFLKESIDVNSFLGRYGATKAGCRKASNVISQNMRSTLDSKKASMKTKLDEIKNCDGFKKLDALIQSIKTSDGKELELYLKESDEDYAILCNCSKDILINKLGLDPSKFQCSGSAGIRWSNELKKISNLPRFINYKNKENVKINNKYLGGFIFNFLIAFLIDIGAIIVLYKWILK